jgi:hypothetical protein
MGACLPVRSSKSMPFQSMLNTISRPIRTAAMSALAAFLSLGMLASTAQADVGVYSAGTLSYLADVVSKVQAASAGSLGAVAGHQLCNGGVPCVATPTLAELQAYTAVLVYTEVPLNDAVGLGNVLADYVDAGGTVVMATFGLTDNALGIRGRFLADNYLPVTQAAHTHGSLRSLVPIQPGHPLLQGVNSFNGGAAASET